MAKILWLIPILPLVADAITSLVPFAQIVSKVVPVAP